MSPLVSTHQGFALRQLLHLLTKPMPVLQAIRLRYLQKEIYTYSGIVLIATNPFARVDSLYVPGMVQVYAGKQRATQAPHLFAIAEEAFMLVTDQLVPRPQADLM
jgi:myosin heavy subunit